MDMETLEYLQLPDALKKAFNCDDIAFMMVQEDCINYKYLPSEQRRKVSVFSMAARKFDALLYAPTERLADVETEPLVVKAIEMEDRSGCFADFMRNVPDKFYNNQKIGLAIARNAAAFGMLSLELRSNPSFLKEAVKVNGDLIKMVDPEFHTQDLVIAAIRSRGSAFYYIHESFYKDAKVVDCFIDACLADEWPDGNGGDFIEFVDKIDKLLLTTKERALRIVNVCGMQLQHLASFKDDNIVVHAAVANDGRAIQFASDELKNDYTIIFAAVAENARAIEHVPLTNELRDDVNFAMKVLRQTKGFRYDGLKRWGPNVRNNPHVVHLAAMQDSWNINWAGEKLQRIDDETMALWSNLMRISLLGYECAPVPYRESEAFTLAAVRIYGARVIDKLPEKLKKDVKFMEKVNAIFTQLPACRKRPRW
jgi:hypothetical protein